MWMPLVKCAAKSVINALITKEKSPKVIIVIGNDKRDSIGFTIKFSNPNTIAKIIAEVKSATCTPLIIFGRKYATTAVMRSLMMTFIIFCNFMMQFNYYFLKKQLFATLLVLVQFTAMGVIILRTQLQHQLSLSTFFVLLGFLVGFWALFVMSKSKFSISPIPRNHALLVQNGIYRWIRHPMYLAVLLFCLGYILEKPDAVNVLTYSILLTDLMIKLHWEENLLSQKFENYKVYQVRTKKLIPFIF